MRFSTTRWSLVIRARGTSREARRALEELCAAYWEPIYCFLRRQGHAPEDARDLTQGFFQHILERDLVARADREAGRFRNYLLRALKSHDADATRRLQAQKRGGGLVIVSLDSGRAIEE